MRKAFLGVFFLLAILNARSQSNYIRQDFYSMALQKEIRHQSIISTPKFSPYFVDTIDFLQPNNLVKNKLFYDNLFQANSSDYNVFLNPEFNFQYMTSGSKTGYINTRGVHISGNLKQKIFFTTAFFENQGRFPDYMNAYVEKYAVLPGYSRMKPYRESDWDYASAIGSLIIQPNDIFYFRLGHDKLIIGNGHRSLLLSDASFQTFFLQSSAKIGKFRFSNLTMQLMNPNFNHVMDPVGLVSLEGNYPRKLNSIHVLEYSPIENLTVTFFESVIFHTENGNSPFAIQMINPFIISRSIMLGYYSEHNLLTGIDVNYQFESAMFYVQYLIDALDFGDINMSNSNNRYAYQIGSVIWDVFKLQGLNLRFEHNYVKAGCYAETNPDISFTHYNQSLAHPSGNNFAEFLTQVQYQHLRWAFQSQINYWISGDDIETLLPLDLPSEIPYILGNKHQRIYFDTEIGFMLNPSWRAMLYTGITVRMDEISETWLRAGLRTNIHRQIRDF
jgi:hypothetical protein